MKHRATQRPSSVEAHSVPLTTTPARRSALVRAASRRPRRSQQALEPPCGWGLVFRSLTESLTTLTLSALSLTVKGLVTCLFTVRPLGFEPRTCGLRVRVSQSLTLALAPLRARNRWSERVSEGSQSLTLHDVAGHLLTGSLTSVAASSSCRRSADGGGEGTRNRLGPRRSLVEVCGVEFVGPAPKVGLLLLARSRRSNARQFVGRGTS